MSKKPKIDKRLDKLFKDINPEESDSKSKRSLQGQKETPLPPVGPKPVQKKTEAVSIRMPIKRQTLALTPPDATLAPHASAGERVITQENENIASAYSVNIQTGFQDWSTLRVVDETNQRQWTADEELLVKQVTDQLSLALENAHLFQETQKRASELATLNQIVQAISEQIELKDVLKTAYDEIAKLIPVDAFFVALYDEKSNTVSYPIVIDEGKYFEEPDGPLNPENFSGKTIISGKLIFETVKPEDVASNVVNVVDDTTLGNTGKSFGTLLFLPLRGASKTIGCISIQSYDFFAYQQDDVALLENIANQISIGIQNAQLYNNAKRTNEELALLNALSKELTKLLSLSEISELALKYASQLMDTSSFFICLINHEKQEISYPLYQEDNVRIEVLPRGPRKAFGDHVMRTNQPLFLPDRIEEHMEELGIEKKYVGTSLWAKSWLGVPMSIDDRVLGAVVVQNVHQEYAHTEHHRDLLLTIAQQIAVALENSRLFELSQASEANARKINEELAVLNALSKELTKLLSLAEISELTYKYTGQLMDTSSFFMCLLDNGRQELSFPFLFEDGEKIETSPRKLGNGLTDYVIRTNQPLYIPEHINERRKEIGVDNLLVGGPTDAISWLGVPMSIGNRVLGAIVVQSIHQEHLYTEHHRDLLLTIAQQTAVALENARLFLETQKFKLGIDSTENAVFITDPNGVIQYTNPGFEKIYGYKNEEALGKTPRILKSGLIPDEQYKNFWATLLGGGTISGELVNKTKDGRIIPVSGTNSPILDENGKVLGFLAVHQDISERKKSEEALSKSEADLRALFSSMEDVVLVYDRDGRYVRIAPTNPSRPVKPPEELLGRLTHEVLPKETADRFVNAIRQTLDSGETIQLEYDLTVENETYWFLANLSKLDDNNVFWVARDITERKKSDESIRKRNEYLAASSEIGKLVTSTLDLNTIFARTVNLINERFSFYHASIFIVEETGFNAALRESTGEAGAEMKRNKHSLPVNDKSIVGKVALDGKAVVVNDVMADSLHRFNPLLPETRAEAAIPLRIGNRTIGAIDIQAKTAGAFSDDEVTVLQTVADQVAVAIDNARSFELSQQAVMEMREIDRLKSQFLANMSHELRTPLNSIIGFSRVIIKGIDGPVTELQQQDLTAIYNSGQHLLGLINDILDLSKIEAGKMELAFDEVNIVDVTSSVLSTMSGLIKDKPIQMKRIIEPNLPTVRADAIRIRQVMINLLSNAFKFTDEGDIVVEVGLKPGATGRKELRVSVTDTGPGISKQDQTKLFQPFSQVDDSPTRKTGGTGLGLSICQHIINMHGGRIWIDSDVGKGSTFHFTLPLFRKENESESTPGGNKIILAIDDDPQVIGLYERYLHPQGYQVIPLSDPSHAVERVKQIKPFAVTLDIMMPGIDGWQILDSLKADPETRDIPIIVCSIIEDLEKGFSLGATDYLVKPILEDDIVNALDRLNADGSIREVLVIDDDSDDLRLIGKILTDDGRYKAILAEGGRMGWDIISSGNPPHAVILDLFMPEMDGFKILENMQTSQKLRDIPVIVISGMDISVEQKNQLNEFGQRLLSKGSFNEKELLTSIQRSLERVHAKNK